MSRTRYEVITRQEDVPDRPPDGRYRTGHGYVQLQWKMGEYHYRWCYEHRLLAGFPAGQLVHHRNDDPGDNRPENLETMTQSEHRHHHLSGHLPTEEIIGSYLAGEGGQTIAKRYGTTAMTIRRLLITHGIQMRPIGSNGWGRTRKGPQP